MGNKPCPYTSIRAYLWGEEIIHGDRYDPSNALKWDLIILNLPGNMDYDPTDSWVYKHDMLTGRVANYFGTYIDNIQTVGGSEGACRQVQRQ
eukprot:10131431-Ditylum_brightwellii.AAC.2